MTSYLNKMYKKIVSCNPYFEVNVTLSSTLLLVTCDVLASNIPLLGMIVKVSFTQASDLLSVIKKKYIL